MKRRMMLAMFMVLALMSGVGPAGAQELSRPNFSSDQVAAQAYFEAGGGTAENNFNNMDTDGNGVACDEPGAFLNGGPSAGPDDGPSAGPEGCADFATQEEAQTYFDNGSGTDVLNLDADGNGIACDESGVEQDGGPTAGPEGCADFATQEEAQTYLDNGGGTDVLNLDPDGNGIACDEGGNVTADSGESEPVVSGLPSTGSGVQPQANSFPVTLAGGTSLLLAIVAIAIWRDIIRQA